MKIKSKRIIMSLFGMTILGIVLGLLRKANLGVDPFSAFVLGSGKVFNITYGVMFSIITAIFLIVVFLLDKHFIGIATILNLIIVGPIADFTLNILNNLYQASNLWIQLGTLLVALIILCFASALYITADLGVSSYDAMSLILAKKLEGKTWGQYRYCRIFTDSLCVILGYFTGGTIGVGTIITAFFIGPFTQFFIDYVTKPLLYGKGFKKISIDSAPDLDKI